MTKIWHNRWLALSLLTSMLAGLIPASVAWGQEEARITLDQLPPVLVVGETQTQLQAMGCVAREITAAHASFLIPVDIPRPVLPSDISNSSRPQLWFCSQSVVQQLNTQGQVQGAWEVLQKIGEGIKLTNPLILFDKALDLTVGKRSQCASTDPFSLFQCLVKWLIIWTAKTSNYLLHWMASGIAPLLTSGFIAHPFVRAAWPFVLGMANLGFVLALLFIALTTTLRISGFDWRRMLVRLLIAALLINFSLIIAGVIVDASRLAMAVMYQGMTAGGRDISFLGAQLLQGSDIVKQAFYFAKDPAQPDQLITEQALSAKTNSIIELLWATIFIVALTIAFGILLVGLLGRYLMLIFLLSISPLAYLFVALPGTAGLAKQWWTRFLKYVVYGPAVLFVLALLVSFQTNPDIERYFLDQFGPFFGQAVTLIMSIAFVIGATKVGSALGTTAGGAILGFAAGLPGRGIGYVQRGVGYAKTGYGYAAKGVSATRETARFVERRLPRGKEEQARRDEYKKTLAELKKEPEKRAAEAGKKAATEKYEERYASPERREQIQKERQFKAQAQQLSGNAQGTLSAIQRGEGAFSTAGLSSSSVVASMDDFQLKSAATLGNKSQANALANALAGMPAELSRTLDNAQIDAVLGASDAMQQTDPERSADLLRGLVSNPEIVKKLESSGKLAAVENRVHALAPTPVAMPVFTGMSPDQIEQTKLIYSQAQADFNKQQTVYKEALNGLRSSVEQILGPGKKTP